MAMKNIGPGLKRWRRSPTFPMGGVMQPFGLYPLMAFPMLAGETLESFSAQGRFISQPMKHPITGAWFESWAVTVPMRLVSEALVTDIAPSWTGLTAASDRPRFFTKATGLDTIKKAYDLVANEFFQTPGITAPTVDAVMQLPRMGVDWTENLQAQPASGDPSKWPVEQDEQELTGLDLETERVLMESADYRRWQQQFGVDDPKKEYRGKVLRYQRWWSLPQNVIDPATGVPRSAFFWDIKFGMEKNFRAREHCIVLMLGAWRPLMFNGNTVASYIQRMGSLTEWLPPKNEAAWTKIGADDPIFAAAFDTDNSPLIFDRSDVWARGESFVNCSSAESPYPVPVSANANADTSLDTIRSKYPTAAETNALFVGSTATDRVVHYQAIGMARILGHVQEVISAGS